jgi:hypothetical protein
MVFTRGCRKRFQINCVATKKPGASDETRSPEVRRSNESFPHADDRVGVLQREFVSALKLMGFAQALRRLQTAIVTPSSPVSNRKIVAGSGVRA